MKFPAIVFLSLSAAALSAGACLAQQTAPQPADKLAPPAAVPAPAAPAPAHHTRSLKKAPLLDAPAPAPASKPESGAPDVVVGGLPGAKAEREP